MIFGWYALLLPALSLWIALIETDAVLIGQWMISRPLLVGPIIGAACGDFTMGLGVGVLTELFCLEGLPVGSVVPLNGTVAAGSAVLLMGGPDAVPVAAAFPAGLGLGLGHTLLECRIRGWRARLVMDAAESLEEEGEVDWLLLLGKSVGVHVAGTAVLIYAGAALLGPGLAWLWDGVPGFCRQGLETGFRIAPWIGLAALMQALFRKN
ncbi:PTS sugar transporter subunit IIC [Elusimicrobiota bacterium]